MRGKLLDVTHGWAPWRIIPAHAGQTESHCQTGRPCADHPRTCGANRNDMYLMMCQCGSSPHMRGKLCFGVRCFQCERIIPAHAGQTRSWHTGENRQSGSSPHMRGKRGFVEQAGAQCWIIPAHAGQTAPAHARRVERADHPRTCGANQKGDTTAMSLTGSSPHMRGKRGYGAMFSPPIRIIPAHAGQTPWVLLFPPQPTDHPRTCGANAMQSMLCQLRVGSSPHMRGKLERLVGLAHRLRIIPAHAGQTPGRGGALACEPDHPRTCGANGDLVVLRLTGDGSSPHMRGKRAILERPAVTSRIIPAHAGQTDGR